MQGQTYMAANAILQPSKFSVSSMAILQQTSNSLRRTFFRIFEGGKDIPKHLHLIKSTYDTLTLRVENKISDGDKPYPSGDKEKEGMSLEFRYALSAFAWKLGH